MNTTKHDQIFIINRYCSPQNLAKEILNSSTNVLIISSHFIFPEERKEIEDLITDIKVDYLEFDAWNSTIDQAKLDEQAFIMSKRWIKYLSIYHSMLKVNVIYLKNKYIYKKLNEQGYLTDSTLITAFCSSYDLYNLGISYNFWKSLKVKIVKTNAFSDLFLIRKRITYIPVLRILSYYISSIIKAGMPKKMYRVTDQFKYYVMDTHRVHFKPNLEVKKVWFAPVLIYFQNAYLATPIHSKSKVLNLYPIIKRSKTVLISDAYRPSTYPHYFALGYFGSKIIVKNKLDYNYFNKANLEILPFDELIDNKRMLTQFSLTNKSLNSVCLSLNHAVDFCSVISRCDTDKLINSVASIAQRMSETQFVIRLHPTSNLPQGEGLKWSNRIQKIVTSLKISNLKISSNTLLEDWEECSIFISEYSLSVVDSIVFGNFAIFANLTNRSSFAIDLKNAGFQEVNSESDLENKIAEIINNPQEALVELKKAANNFNQMFYPILSKL